MLVSDIVDVTKTRSKVFLDGQFAFVLYKGELRKYHITKENEMSDEIYSEIMTEVLPKRAKLRCMNLLQSREYTEKKLRDKLITGGYPAQIVEEAVAYVKSYKYINDERYAASYIEMSMDKKSKQRIVQDLLQKGVSKDCIDAQWRKLEELGVEADESKLIEELLQKKKYNPDESDLKEKQRIFAFLLRKGFSSERIRSAMQL